MESYSASTLLRRFGMEWPPFAAKLAKRSEVVLGAALFLVLLLGLLDHWTGQDLSFVLFYLLPILLASWYGGAHRGRWVALASVAAWWWADWTGQGLSRTVLWNVTEKLAFFLVFAHVVSALKRSVAHEYERELEIGREVQQRLFPNGLPNVQGLDVGVRLIPNRALSGDYYDFFPSLSGLGVVVADVMGKGVSASLLTASVHAILHSAHLPRQENGVARMVGLVNDHLFRSTDSGRFVTLAYASLHPERDALDCVVAGHPAALLWSPGDVRQLDATGPVLGVLPGAAWSVHRAPFLPGALLLLYTDGVIEAANGNGGEELGVARLGNWLAARAATGEGAQSIIDGLVGDLVAWTGTETFEDDVALLAVRRVPLVPSVQSPAPP